ncbi:MAG: YciI family protein [Pseudomonadota bacterium]|jgi:uncharacterized protein YciI
MLYVIIGRDVPHSLEKRRAARPAHVDRLKALLAEGRVAISGPMPAIDSPDPGPAGYSGSVIIAEFPSLAAARAWADTDPYLLAGVYASVEVSPYVQVLP